MRTTLRNRGRIIARFAIALFIIFSRPGFALEIYDAGVFVNSSTFGGTSLGALDGVFDDFVGTGIDYTFANNLDANGLGSLDWSFTNNTGISLVDVMLFGYLDAEIDSSINSSFNEFGQLISVAGTGPGDTAPESWEIDEPGFVFGDIYDNLFLGALDNSNGVPQGSEDDVSLALGFALGTIADTEQWMLSLTTSETDIGGLYHGDPDSITGFYFNGEATVIRSTPPGTVPEPSGLALLALGLLIAIPRRARRKR